MQGKILFFVIAVIAASFFFLYKPQPTQSCEPCLINPQPKGAIILLNGVSSVGKSSIQKALQDLMEEPYIALGIDNLLVGALPKKCMTGDFLNIERPSSGVVGIHGYYEPETQEKLFKLEFGDACKKLVAGMHRTFTAMADTGNNIVIDYILYEPSWLADLVYTLYGYKVYLIGVKASLDTIEKREKKRRTSPEGHAKAYYTKVHENMEYDMTVDTSELSPEQAAENIKSFVQKNPQPRALAHLYKKVIG